MDRLSHKSNVIDLTGSTSLRESFSVVKHSKLLISNDSAPVHIAVSFNTPVVDIYGPTVREFGFTPTETGWWLRLKVWYADLVDFTDTENVLQEHLSV